MAQRQRIRLAGGIWSWLALAVPLASLVIGGGQALAGPAAAKASPVRSQPSEPESVTVRVSAHSATVTWSRPAVDGGAPITSYLVTATPDGASVRVGPKASRATITGLTNAFADVFAVTAINSAGMSAAGTFGPAAQVISGTLRYPAAPASKPVPGDQVLIYDLPPGTAAPVQRLIGTVVTDQAGKWNFTLPPFASLPAAVRAAAAGNGGILDVEADAYATATTSGGPSYLETATTFESAWIGTGTGGPPAGLSAPEPQAMVLTPAGPDNSARDTPANQAATWAARNDPATTGGPADPAAGPPLDRYGYQSIGPDHGYDPYVAYDGTNLTGVVPRPFLLPDHPPCTHWDTVPFHGPRWSTIGEVHDSNNSTGSFAYTKGSDTSFDVEYSADGGADWAVTGSRVLASRTESVTTTWPKVGPKNSLRTRFYEDYSEVQRNFSKCMGYPAFHKDWIWADGEHVGGPFPMSYGGARQLNGTDSATAFCLAKLHHPHWPQPVPRGFTVTWNWGKGYGYKLGATILGVGVGTETNYTDITSVIYTAGKSKKRYHVIWGINGNPYFGGQGNGSQYGGDPKIIYSYDIPSGTPPCA